MFANTVRALILKRFMVLWLLVVCVPLQVNAAGLGAIEVYSTLGEVLRAKILVSAKASEIAGMTVRLASPQAFRTAGIDFSSTAAAVVVKLLQEGGKPVVHLSSTGPMSNGFVDLLVELSWPTGRHVREYTLVLESKRPPSVNGQIPILSYQNPAITEAVPPSDVLPGSNNTQAPPIRKPRVTSSAIRPNVNAAPIPRRPTSRATPRSRVTTGANTQIPRRGSNRHRVKRGQTMHQIAKTRVYSGVTLQQMMVAIYQKNRRAFIKNNVNLVRTGANLIVPSRGEVQKISQGRARNILRSHYQEWVAYRQSIAKVPTQVAEQKSSRSSGGQISSRANEVVTPNKQDDRVKIKADKAAQASTQLAQVSRSSVQQNQLAKQEAEIAKKEAELDKITKKVQDVQRLLDLRNQKLAQLTTPNEPTTATTQSEASGNRTRSDSAASKPVVEPPARRAASSNNSQAEPRRTRSRLTDETTRAPAGDNNTPTANALSSSNRPSRIDRSRPRNDPNNNRVTRTTENDSASMLNSAFSFFLDNLLLVGGGILIILAGLLLTTYRRSHKNSQTYDDDEYDDDDPPGADGLSNLSASSQMVGGAGLTGISGMSHNRDAEQSPSSMTGMTMSAQDNLSVGTTSTYAASVNFANVSNATTIPSAMSIQNSDGGQATGAISNGFTDGINQISNLTQSVNMPSAVSTAQASGGSAHGSLISEFSEAGPGVIDTEDVDPIAEADVYMAYNRDSQAEEILLEALTKNPSRQEIHMKLAELYYKHKRVEEFFSVARDVFTLSSGKGQQWRLIMRYGNELDSANPLYHDTASTEENSVTPTAENTKLSMSPTLSTLEFTGVSAIDASEAAEANETNSKMYLENALNYEQVDLVTQEDDVDQSYGSENSENNLLDVPTALRGESDEQKLDQLTQQLREQNTAPIPTEKNVADVLNSISLDLTTDEQGLSVALNEELSRTDVNNSTTDQPIENDDPDAFLLANQKSIDANDFRNDEDDDIGTKLELAYAYREMGDLRGAKELAEEIIESGNQDYRDQAEQLRTEIDQQQKSE